MHTLKLSTGFSVNFTRALRDSNNNNVIILDIAGPKQAVRATHAHIKSRTTYNYALGGKVKLDKNTGHHILETELPCGWVNWTIISHQAIPQKLNPELPVYVWKEPDEYPDTDIPPAMFYPVFSAATPFPTLEEWTTYLWQQGMAERIIQKIGYSNSTSLNGWRIVPKIESWDDIIRNGFQSHEINLGVPVPPPPPEKPPAATESDDWEDMPIIDVYTSDDAIDDGYIVDPADPPFPPPKPGEEENAEPTFEEKRTLQIVKSLNNIEGIAFQLGRILISNDVYHLIETKAFQPFVYLFRHSTCDWGNLDEFDTKANNNALINDTRIFSAYDTEEGRLYIITEADRSSTTIITPSEY